MVEIEGLENCEQAIPREPPLSSDGRSGLHDLIKGAPRYRLQSLQFASGPCVNVADDSRDLINTYHELNSSAVDVLASTPSPLEFLRYVSQNRPFVIRNGAADWPARARWNAQYLREVMQGQDVNVAITPTGNADSVYSLPDHQGKLFVKPLERDEPFESMLHAIQLQERESATHTGATRYAQTQNDNLRGEYSTLFADVPASIPFARIALDKEPDAINFWLGNSHSMTALHKDNYENIYVQIIGRKHFVLLPPVESACVGEKSLLAATFTTRHQQAFDETVKTDDLVIEIDEPVTYTPFATWDPDEPDTNATPFSEYSRPLRVTLEEGDVLYLPALWYHKVSQSCSDEDLCCAVNYWYDLDFSGGFWTMSSFVRSIGQIRQKTGQDETMHIC